MLRDEADGSSGGVPAPAAASCGTAPDHHPADAVAASVPGAAIAGFVVPPGASGTTPAPGSSGATGVAGSWPADHVPSGTVEREMWDAFDALKRKPGARISLSAVAKLSRHSRTPISHDDGEFGVLRRAILDEMDRRRPPKPVEPTPQAAAALAAERKERKVNHWRAVAREADSINAAYEARAVAADARTERSNGVLRRILADMRSGRWVRADASSVLIGEIEVLLGSPAKGGQEPGDEAV